MCVRACVRVCVVIVTSPGVWVVIEGCVSVVCNPPGGLADLVSGDSPVLSLKRCESELSELGFFKGTPVVSVCSNVAEYILEGLLEQQL